jgi:1-acyl-sn-glycerol-3-phosphate acyltransferase
MLGGSVPYSEREVHEGAGPWALRVGGFLDHVLYRTEIEGQELIPSTGGVLVAANHVGLLDGPLLYGAFPREGHIIVKREMFDNPLVGPLLHYSGQIGLDRAGDRKALARATALLKKGKIVGILPEGTRGTGVVDEINTGVAWLAVTAGVPVIPAAILGTRRTGQSRSAVPFPRTRLAVHFGQPLDVTKKPGETGRDTMKRAAEEIRAALAQHVSDAQARTGLRLPVA